jgi:hypothetical protein
MLDYLFPGLPAGSGALATEATEAGVSFRTAAVIRVTQRASFKLGSFTFSNQNEHSTACIGPAIPKHGISAVTTALCNPLLASPELRSPVQVDPYALIDQ